MYTTTPFFVRAAGRDYEPKEILIVDDDEELLYELHQMLSGLNGYVITITSDPQEVVQIARRRRPRAIILDINMAGLNGFRVAEQLKNCRATRAIPIIAISGYLDASQYEGLIHTCSIEAYLCKPFDPAALIATVEKFTVSGKQPGRMALIAYVLQLLRPVSAQKRQAALRSHNAGRQRA